MTRKTARRALDFYSGGVMLTQRFMVPMLSVCMTLPGAGAGVVCAQYYPNKTIRMVTGTVGSSVDSVARPIAQGLAGNMGQPVIVDNRGGGVVPGETVAKAAPDGYTLLVHASTFYFAPLLQKTPYDPVKDFSPITVATSSPGILVVHPSVPVKLVKELIALAKARPGELNYASGNSGSIPHLAAELFKAMAGVNIVHIPYNGSGPALNGLIGGQVHLMISAAGPLTPHVKSGRLKALAVTSATPSALAPGLPTVAASGLPGYESASMTGIFAPVNTPETLINRLNQEIVRVINTPEAKERFLNSGVETVGGSPQELAAAVKSEMARMGKVIKDAGIRVE
ncbi:MAG: tripartite tricarboxylate transporter substrate binding protein [Betaproteobacteria bacterium]|nr:tripartite tricarboxylate transporter substrate binding protein [Betaproteobacteria bacterium]